MRILIRHFFERFFDKESLSPQGEPEANFTQTLGFLAAPGAFIVLLFLPLGFRAWDLVMIRCFFVSFSMIIMGFIVVFEWDALFPDRRDYQILTPLPVGLWTLFLAKAMALSLFLGVFLGEFFSLIKKGNRAKELPSAWLPLVRRPSPPQGGSGVEVSDPDEARCLGCGTMFDAAAIDEIQTRQVTQIPAATMQLAIKMLNRPAKWIHGQRTSRALVPVYGYEGFNMLFPLAAICQLAKSQGLRVLPLEQSEALWIPKAKTAQRSS